MATGNKLFLFVQDTSVTAADTFTLSAWNHVAVTYSSQSVRFYVNGVADSGNPQALAANPVYDGTNFWIGAQNINNKHTGCLACQLVWCN